MALFEGDDEVGERAEDLSRRGGNQWQSVAISGNQWQSVPIAMMTSSGEAFASSPNHWSISVHALSAFVFTSMHFAT